MNLFSHNIFQNVHYDLLLFAYLHNTISKTRNSRKILKHFFQFFFLLLPNKQLSQKIKNWLGKNSEFTKMLSSLFDFFRSLGFFSLSLYYPTFMTDDASWCDKIFFWPPAVSSIKLLGSVIYGPVLFKAHSWQ